MKTAKDSILSRLKESNWNLHERQSSEKREVLKGSEGWAPKWKSPKYTGTIEGAKEIQLQYKLGKIYHCLLEGAQHFERSVC